MRVSATAGIAEPIPVPYLYGSTAAALDLVFDPVTDYASVERRSGPTVWISVKEGSALDVERLRESLRFAGMKAARVVDDGTIALTFESAEVAQAFEGNASMTGVATGPFRTLVSEDGRIVLASRHHHSIDQIEILSVSKEDEWRLLLGRRIDVAPRAEESERKRFSGVPSIRLLDIPTTHDHALYFNVRSPRLAAPETRRRIAHMIDRATLSAVVCGSDRCEVAAGVDQGMGPLPQQPLTLIVVQGESVAKRAAERLRTQLRRGDIEVLVEVEPMDRFRERGARGEYDLALAPLPRGKSKYRAYAASSYDSAEFRDAVSRGALQEADRILARDAPATPLYEMKMFAAVDKKLCGDVTPRADSWRWIADLRPCKDGEKPK